MLTGSMDGHLTKEIPIDVLHAMLTIALGISARAHALQAQLIGVERGLTEQELQYLDSLTYLSDRTVMFFQKTTQHS